MKKEFFLPFMILLAIMSGVNAEERPPREYVPVTGKLSLSRTVPIYQAMQILSEISGRLDKKLIIDETGKKESINVDILDMHWRDALALIARMNGLAYAEYPNYIKVAPGAENGETKPAPGEIKKEDFSSRMREVTISAIFFEGDRHAMKERGINWAVLIKSGNTITEIKNQVIADQEAQGSTNTGA